MTFAELFRAGGLLMWPLAVLSVFALADAVYLLVALRAGAVAPRALVRDVLDAVRAGDFAAARKECDWRPCPFSRVALAALDAARVLPHGESAALSSAVEGEGSREAVRLSASAQWLLDIAAVAPMLGLLGTVLGMFTAFQGVGGDMVASAKPVVLAQGVSLALVTTVAGLVVAIPCMILYAFMRRRAESRTAALEIASQDLVNALLAGPPRQ